MSNYIKDTINILLNDAFLGDIARQLLALHESHGSPVPADGPSTEIRCGVIAHSDGSDMGEWQDDDGNDRVDDVARVWNDAIDRLYEAVDYCHVGSGIVHTQYYAGSDDWEKYKIAALDIIHDWVVYDAWELFCRDPYGICESASDVNQEVQL